MYCCKNNHQQNETLPLTSAQENRNNDVQLMNTPMLVNEDTNDTKANYTEEDQTQPMYPENTFDEESLEQNNNSNDTKSNPYN